MAQKTKETFTLVQMMAELEQNAVPSAKAMLMKHGAREPFFGVRAEVLKKIVKRVGIDHPLALQLYDTGNSDAMYLAGLLCDPKQMTPDVLQKWVVAAYWSWLSEYTVPWVASMSPHGFEMAMKWIDDPSENIASSGWSTLSSLVMITENDQIDNELISSLIARVTGFINLSPNRVKYAMNNFMISAAVYMPEFTQQIITLSEIIGKVKVDMAGTACKVPYAPEYINKTILSGRGAKKRKDARCL